MNPKDWQKIVTLYQKGRYSDAQRKLIKLCDEISAPAEAFALLGTTYLKLENTTAAKEAIKRALSLQPQSVTALIAIADCYFIENNYAAAQHHFSEAIRRHPGELEARVKYSDCLAATNHLSEAKTCLQQALQIKSDYHPALERLGDLHHREGNHSQAIAQYERAISIKPQLPEAHARLARSLHSQGSLEKAAHHYKEALKYNRRSVDANINLGYILTLLGELDQAIGAYDQALKLDKNNLDAVSGKSSVLAKQKKHQQAFSLVCDFIKKGTAHPGIAHLLSRLTPRFSTPESTIDYLESTLTTPQPSRDQKALICYDLGKLYDSKGEYDQAFAYYRQANELIPYAYDPAGHATATASLIEVCDRKTLASLPHASHNTHRPIFIIGMPRSGTSLVEQILASHSSVHGAGELKVLGDIAASIQQKVSAGKPYPYCLQNMGQELVDELSNIYLEKINRVNQSALYITDKMPHNFLHLGLIELLFPQAHIIHCTRNPLDTCLSIYFQKFNASHSYANDLNDLGYHYLEYQKIMEHWKRAISHPVLDINYESMVENCTAESKRLLAFCGLEWEEQCLQFYKTGRFVNTASDEQINKPIYSHSVHRWKHYVKHIAPLINLLRQLHPPNTDSH